MLSAVPADTTVTGTEAFAVHPVPAASVSVQVNVVFTVIEPVSVFALLGVVRPAEGVHAYVAPAREDVAVRCAIVFVQTVMGVLTTRGLAEDGVKVTCKLPVVPAVLANLNSTVVLGPRKPVHTLMWLPPAPVNEYTLTPFIRRFISSS